MQTLSAVEKSLAKAHKKLIQTQTKRTAETQWGKHVKARDAESLRSHMNDLGQVLLTRYVDDIANGIDEKLTRAAGMAKRRADFFALVRGSPAQAYPLKIDEKFVRMVKTIPFSCRSQILSICGWNNFQSSQPEGW